MHTTLYSIIYILTFFDQLFGFAIFNKGAYLIYISIYQKALNLFQLDYENTLEFVPGSNQH